MERFLLLGKLHDWLACCVVLISQEGTALTASRPLSASFSFRWDD
jgi:hypothetical protein